MDHVGADRRRDFLGFCADVGAVMNADQFFAACWRGAVLRRKTLMAAEELVDADKAYTVPAMLSLAKAQAEASQRAMKASAAIIEGKEPPNET